MHASRSASGLLALGLAVLAGCGGGPTAQDGAEPKPESPARDEQALKLARTAPPELARLYREGGEILGGGPRAFRARLAELRGHPVVVNKWASWCGPCRSELPYFRRQALRQGRRIAFVGSNTNDSAGPARRFLAEVPLPFPSYADPEGEIARVFEGAVAFPATAFYRRDGRLVTVKQGVYASERELVADIARYAR